MEGDAVHVSWSGSGGAADRIVFAESMIGQIESIVAGVFFVPSGAFVRAAFGASVCVAGDRGSAHGAFGGSGAVGFRSESHAWIFRGE